MFQPYRIVRKLGSKQKRIIENGHDKVSTWGIGKELSKEDWFTLSDALIHAGLIEKNGDYHVLSITESGKQVLTSRAKIELPVELMGQRALTQRGSKTPASTLRRRVPHLKKVNINEVNFYALWMRTMRRCMGQ